MIGLKAFAPSFRILFFIFSLVFNCRSPKRQTGRLLTEMDGEGEEGGRRGRGAWGRVAGMAGVGDDAVMDADLAGVR